MDFGGFDELLSPRVLQIYRFLQLYKATDPSLCRNRPLFFTQRLVR